MMQRAATFFIAEIRTLCVRPTYIISLLTSIATILLLLHFGIGKHSTDNTIMPVLLLAVLIITFTNITQDAFHHDAQQGRIVHWCYSPIALEWIIFSKWLAYLLSSALPVTLLLTLILTEGRIDSALFTIFFTTALVIISCGFVASALSLCFESSQLMGYVLTIPFTLSVMIFAAEGLNPSNTSMNAQILLYALSLTLTPLSLWITSRIIRLAV
jgi:ABC-type transport system involved in cytochrome c biogenesis permease component